jgi:hypothetical protein
MISILQRLGILVFYYLLSRQSIIFAVFNFDSVANQKIKC